MDSEDQKRFNWIKNVYGDWEEHAFMIKQVEQLEDKVTVANAGQRLAVSVTEEISAENKRFREVFEEIKTKAQQNDYYQPWLIKLCDRALKGRSDG